MAGEEEELVHPPAQKIFMQALHHNFSLPSLLPAELGEVNLEKTLHASLKYLSICNVTLSSNAAEMLGYSLRFLKQLEELKYCRNLIGDDCDSLVESIGMV